MVFIIMFFSCSEENSVDPQPEPTPILSTKDVSFVTATTALSTARLIFDEQIVVLSFGICCSTNEAPTLADNRIEVGFILVPNWDFLIPISGLSPNTKYYVRTYIEGYDDNTIYGNIVSFTTLAYTDSVTDIDSNVYHAVPIGTRVWTVENLKVTHYRNGDPIPNITDDTQWGNLTTGAYCDPDNNLSNVSTFGRFYNWYAVVDTRILAPEGWDVPSNDDWQDLINFLGGADSANIKMREPGEEHWREPENVSTNRPIATNESGFLALPGGSRGYFDPNSAYSSAAFWSSTDYDIDNAWRFAIDRWSTSRDYGHRKTDGFSVRLVKDR